MRLAKILLFLSTIAIVMAAGSAEDQVRNGPSSGSTTSEPVTPLTEANFDEFLKAHDNVFVNFYAPWAVWCQRMAPTWDKFAQEVKRQQIPVEVANVDCMAQADICRTHKVRAFPTLRWYRNGEPTTPDYKMDRTIGAFMKYTEEKLGASLEKEHAMEVGGADSKDTVASEFASKPYQYNFHKASPSNDAKAEPDFTEDSSSSEDAREWKQKGGRTKKIDTVAEAVPAADEGAPIPYGDTYAKAAPDTPTKLGRLGSPLVPGETKMMSKCQAAGFPYGTSNQRLSLRGGDEFHDFSGRQVKISPVCTSPSSNSRGQYNSFFAPCTFQFHVASTADGDPGDNFQLSTKCSDENGSLEEPLSDYVRAWPDECVGDFKRCYSVSKESEAKIFLRHFCLQQWELPAAVTHISVTCEADKKEAITKKQGSSIHEFPMHALEQEARHHREKLIALWAIVGLAGCCGWVLLCCGYKFVVEPYLKTLKKSRSDPDLQSLVTAEDGKSDKVST